MPKGRLEDPVAGLFAPNRAAFLLLTVTLGAGLVLSGCGDDDTATTPAPAPPPPPPPPAPEPEPEPEPPAPEAPATPTGLHVDETTQTSIEWHWNAVEGAIGYAVQISMDEMFDASDTIAPTAETHYTVSDLEPMTSVYLRVAAAAGTLEAPILSAWSTHVTGMSAMPPPMPEPVPAQIMVEFMLPAAEDDKDCKGYAMCPDDETDEEMAMASVNTGITVSVMPEGDEVSIEPYGDGWDEDIMGLSVGANNGDMPFAFSTWNAMQSAVVGDGVTFKITRIQRGANQEVEPTPHMAYVTCGPFRCMGGMDAPEISLTDSKVCETWEYTLDLQVGFVDNTAMNIDSNGDTAGDIDGDARLDDGIDLGWVYTSNFDMAVTHHFGGGLKVQSPDAKKSPKLQKALDMAGKVSASKTTSEADFGPAIIFAAPNIADDADGVEGLFGGVATGVTFNASERWACDSPSDLMALPLDDDGAADTAETADTVSSDYTSSNLTVTKPDGCFRVVSHRIDYLQDYMIELAPKGSSVSWGSVEWEDSPFVDAEGEALACPSKEIDAIDQVNVCDLFEEEVDRALAEGWNAGSATVSGFTGRTIAAGTDTTDPSSTNTGVEGVSDNTAASGAVYHGEMRAGGQITWSASSKGSQRQFSTIWFDQDGPDAGKKSVDLYDGTIVLKLLDDDGDPKGGDFGDIGKIDLTSPDAKNGPGTTGDQDLLREPKPDGKADNYSGSDATCSEDDGGTDKCDAVVEITRDITFSSGTAFDCEHDATVTFTCTWDAQGRLGTGETGGLLSSDASNTTGRYLSCKVSS